jgi:hypothetical protein
MLGVRGKYFSSGSLSTSEQSGVSCGEIFPNILGGWVFVASILPRISMSDGECLVARYFQTRRCGACKRSASCVPRLAYQAVMGAAGNR